MTYFLLQCKKSLRLLPTAAAVSALLFVSVLFFAGSMLRAGDDGASMKKVRVGITGDIGGYLGLGISAMEQLDASRFSIELVRVPDEGTASAMLREGTLNACLVVPDGFYDAVSSYDNGVPLRYISTAGAVGISTIMMNEIADAVADLLLETENAVAGMQHMAMETGVPEDEVPMLGMRFAERYMASILRRDSLFEVGETGFSGRLSYRGYYVCALLLLFLLLMGISGGVLFAGRSEALRCALARSGRGPVRQLIAEYGAYLVLMALIVLCLLPAAGAIISAAGLSIPELSGRTAGAGLLMGLVPAVIPVLVVTAAFQYFLYELIPGTVAGVLAQSAAALLIGYVSGCFYPIDWFPAGMRRASDVLPFGTARRCLEAALRTDPAPSGAVLMLFLWAAGFLLLSLALRRARRR